MKTREEFLKWCENRYDYPNEEGNEIYDYLTAAPDDKDLERIARDVVRRWSEETEIDYRDSSDFDESVVELANLITVALRACSRPKAETTPQESVEIKEKDSLTLEEFEKISDQVWKGFVDLRLSTVRELLSQIQIKIDWNSDEFHDSKQYNETRALIVEALKLLDEGN